MMGKKELLETEVAQSASRMESILKAELKALLLAAKNVEQRADQDNAAMREQIKDLAAKVTSLTASREGPDSPIHKAIGTKPGSTGKPTSKHGAKKNEPESLAERIEDFQADIENGWGTAYP